jgi:hypothetical protein
MANDKINKARDLVDEGKYAQARRLLKGINDPRAKRLMDEIDDLAPAKTSSGARDFLHVVFLAIIFTALFGGIGYVIASGIGIPAAAVTTTPTSVAQQSQTNGEIPDSTTVAVLPTDTPPPTEIPCEAQAWWDANRTSLGQTVDTVLNADARSGADVNNARTTFASWRTAFESETTAPCLSAVKQAITSAATSVDDYFKLFTETVSNEQQRAQGLVRTLDALLPVTDELSTLNVSSADDTWIAAVQDFTRAECPAKRWYNEIILSKDYKRFFAVFDTLDLTQIGAATNSLREMQSLRGSFQADSAAFPECVKPASDALLASMDAFIAYGNAQINNDMANAGAQQQTATTELANFYSTLGSLDASLSGVRLR